MKPSPQNNSAVDDAVYKAMMQAKKTPGPNLLTEGFPFEPALWMIVVEPLEAREVSDGGIAVVSTSQEAEAYQSTVGRVLKCGPAAFEGTTVSGIKLSNFIDGVSEPAHLIGRYVIYQPNTGMQVTLRKTEKDLKIMKITDILGVTDDPYAWKFYI